MSFHIPPDLTYQELRAIVPNIFAKASPVFDTVVELEKKGESHGNGIMLLLFGALMNATGRIEEAERYLLRAIDEDPALPRKVLKPANPSSKERIRTGARTVAVEQCPVCSSGRRTSVFAGLAILHPLYHPGLYPVLHWVQCDECTHVYVGNLNRAGAFEEGPPRLSPHISRPDPARYGRDRVSVSHLAQLRPGGHVLELGPGAGTRMAALRDMGMAVAGIEHSPLLARRCARQGLDVLNEDFFQHRPPTPYDIVVLGDVVEHLPDLHATLTNCRKLTAPDGLLWVSTPLFDDPELQRRRRAGRDPYFVQVEHAHYFTAASMGRLIHTHGYSQIGRRRGSSFLGSHEFTFGKTRYRYEQ